MLWHARWASSWVSGARGERFEWSQGRLWCRHGSVCWPLAQNRSAGEVFGTHGPIHPSCQVQVDPVRLAIAVPDSEVEIAVTIDIAQGYGNAVTTAEGLPGIGVGTIAWGSGGWGEADARLRNRLDPTRG